MVNCITITQSQLLITSINSMDSCTITMDLVITITDLLIIIEFIELYSDGSIYCQKIYLQFMTITLFVLLCLATMKMNFSNSTGNVSMPGFTHMV